MKTLKTILTVLGLALLPRLAHAALMEDVITQQVGANLAVAVATGANSVMLNLSYVGTSTEAVVTITSSLITFNAPAGTADTTAAGDAGQAQSYTLSNSTMNTVGKLCNAINRNSTTYRCQLVGARSNENSNGMKTITLAPGSQNTNLGAAGGYNVLYNAPVVVALGFNPDSGRRVKLKKCIANIVADPAYQDIRVYGKLRKFEGKPSNTTTGSVVTNPLGSGVIGVGVVDDNYLVYMDTIPTAGTASSFDWTLGQAFGGLEFARDAHVVVQAGNGSTAPTTNHKLDCIWEEVSVP